MIVDDDSDIIKLLGILLENNGFNVVAARSGMDCLYKLHSGSLPDLILLDIMMPEKDGYAVCREIKSNFKFADISVVMLTARAENRDRVSAYKTGADGYITKPFNNDTLVKEIIAFLS